MSRAQHTVWTLKGETTYTTTNGVGGGATHHLGPFSLDDAEQSTITWTRFSAVTATAIQAAPSVGGAVSAFLVLYTAVPTPWFFQDGKEARRDPTLPYFFDPGGGSQFTSIPGVPGVDEGARVELADSAWSNFMILMTVSNTVSGLYLALANYSAG